MHIQLPPQRPSTAPIHTHTAHQPAPAHSRSQPLPHLLSNLLPYLSSHSILTPPKLLTCSPVPSHLLTLWDRTNAPNNLPPDLRSFLLTTDGLSLTWTVNIHTPHAPKTKSPIGEIYINSLESITQRNISPHYQTYTLSTSPHGTTYLAFTSKSTIPTATSPHPLTTSHQPPCILFHCLSTNTLHHLAPSFTSYFRLLIAHCGISGWEMSVTPLGLSRETEDWLNYLTPERARLIRKVRVTRMVMGRKAQANGAKLARESGYHSSAMGSNAMGDMIPNLMQRGDATIMDDSIVSWEEALKFWDDDSKDTDIDIPFELEKVEAMVALVEKGKPSSSNPPTGATAKPPVATGVTSPPLRRPYTAAARK
ncbi:Tubulin polyglutamylase complex subunit 2 [Rhizophlyctis rosea]|nr:Tubulin polyglutamylase complex subunit 2 [Rhizophlyctis rosea]